jgi:hypothetical protein
MLPKLGIAVFGAAKMLAFGCGKRAGGAWIAEMVPVQNWSTDFEGSAAGCAAQSARGGERGYVVEKRDGLGGGAGECGAEVSGAASSS